MGELAEPEVVSVVLRDVIYRETRWSSLESYLADRLGFKEAAPVAEPVLGEEKSMAPELPSQELRKGGMKMYKGVYLDTDIEVQFLGEVSHKEEIVEVDEHERYSVYTANYRMIRLNSKSGYAIQRMLEALEVELGLKTDRPEWHFYRRGSWPL